MVVDSLSDNAITGPHLIHGAGLSYGYGGNTAAMRVSRQSSPVLGTRRYLGLTARSAHSMDEHPPGKMARHSK